MRLKPGLLMAPFAALTLLAASCGSDDDTGEPDEDFSTTISQSPTGSAQSPGAGGTRTPSAGNSGENSGPDAEYVQSVCSVGAAFVVELSTASGLYAQDVGESNEAEEIGAALQEHLAPVFSTFHSDMSAIEAPDDVADYHGSIVAQLEEVTAKLEAADPTALSAIVNQQLEPPPGDVAARLNAVARSNPDCQAAGFFIGDAAATPTP